MSLKQLLKIQRKTKSHLSNQASYVISDLTGSIRIGRRIHKILVNRGIYKAVIIRNVVFKLLKKWDKFAKSSEPQLFTSLTNLSKRSQQYQAGYRQGIQDARTMLFWSADRPRYAVGGHDPLAIEFTLDELKRDGYIKDIKA